MITTEELTSLVRVSIPDADVKILRDRQDHLSIHVLSSAFAGMGLMDRHRLVQKTLNAAMNDGRIHALEIKTEIR